MNCLIDNHFQWTFFAIGAYFLFQNEFSHGLAISISAYCIQMKTQCSTQLKVCDNGLSNKPVWNLIFTDSNVLGHQNSNKLQETLAKSIRSTVEQKRNSFPTLTFFIYATIFINENFNEYPSKMFIFNQFTQKNARKKQQPRSNAIHSNTLQLE